MAGLGPALALLLAGANLATASAEPASGEGDNTDVVAARVDPSWRLTVPVRIGEGGPFEFLVDTGAQNTIVGSALAARLALAPAGKASVISVGGRMIIDTVKVDRLTLGSRSFGGIVAPVLSEENIGADGIVGVDSLQHQRVLFDFRRNLISVSDTVDDSSDARAFDIVVRARRRSGQLILTKARIDGVRVDVVVDTGADYSIGNRALQARLGRVGSGRATLVSVTGQRIAAEIGVARTLDVGSLRITNVSIAYADALPFAYLGLGRRPAILLGMDVLHTFKRIAIDFAKRQVLFDLDAGAVPPG
ncbi:MAG: aspartyl protease family protein [Novosphingobium sp.]